jgi:hypothetical protein
MLSCLMFRGKNVFFFAYSHMHLVASLVGGRKTPLNAIGLMVLQLSHFSFNGRNSRLSQSDFIYTDVIQPAMCFSTVSRLGDQTTSIPVRAITLSHVLGYKPRQRGDDGGIERRHWRSIRA